MEKFIKDFLAEAGKIKDPSVHIIAAIAHGGEILDRLKDDAKIAAANQPPAPSVAGTVPTATAPAK